MIYDVKLVIMIKIMITIMVIIIIVMIIMTDFSAIIIISLLMIVIIIILDLQKIVEHYSSLRPSAALPSLVPAVRSPFNESN